MPTLSRWSLRQLRTAVRAEVDAERAAEAQQAEWRRAWWETTWLLAACPRAEWGAAQAEYVKQTGHSKGAADHRRRTGTRLTQTDLGISLPQPRFAEAASNWIGRDGDAAKIAEAVKLLADAERDEMSLREFSQALTGRPWTNAPENLTAADEDVIIQRAARARPRQVARIIASEPAAAAAIDEFVDPPTLTSEQQRELVEDNDRRGREFGEVRDRMTTRLEHTGLVDHEAELEVRAARMHLRRACVEFERNPLLDAEQRRDLDTGLDECEHLIRLLRGEKPDWSDTDREFLTAVGIEDEEIVQ